MTQLAGDHVQILVGGYELTGDSNQVTVNDARAMLDSTTFADAVQNFIPGRRNTSLEHAGFINPATGQSHPALKSAELSGVVSVLLGQNADPVVGDPVYCLKILQNRYSVNPQVGQVIPFSATFNNVGEVSGWGAILAAPIAFTNSINGSSVDNGAQTIGGGAAHLHILQNAASDTYSIKVQGATDAGFTTGVVDLATFTLDASAIGSERIEISGTIPRYTRFMATRSGSAGDTVEIAVFLVRF